jgi:hypothetical protein
MRMALPDFTPIIPATACHQRNYVETYSRCNHLALFLPRIRAIVRPENVAADDLEIFPKLVLQFALPLEGEIGGGDDQSALRQAAYFQLLDEESRHDRFAGAWIIRQEKPNAAQRPATPDERQARAGFPGFGIVVLGILPDPVSGRSKDAGWQQLGGVSP